MTARRNAGYCTASNALSGGGARRRQGEPLGEPSESLVTTPISDTDRLEIFPRSVRVVRPGSGNQQSIPPDRSGSKITGFSDKSRSRLRFAAVNAFPELISQLGLTYHAAWPTNGRDAKRHLHQFLCLLRRWSPGVRYLWLLEFQKRNAPHFHLFLTIPPDEVLRLRLAQAWVTITGGTPEALKFHRHERNWIAWQINNGSYLCKYLDKEAQKSIPEGYFSFGRFWGHSSNLVPEPIKTPTAALSAYDQLDLNTGEVATGETYIIRNLGRLAERQTKGFSRFRKRAPRSSYTILNGTAALFQLESYLAREKQRLRNAIKVPF
jgi:hypothetical protein